MGDPTGDSTAGELMGDLVSELRGDEAGRLTGEAAVGVGEGTEEGCWTGAGEGHSGLLAAREGVEPSVFLSSGMNGSGKKRMPGDFTGVICGSGSGDGLSEERTNSSFCMGLMLDGSILEAIFRLCDFPSSSGSTSHSDWCKRASASASEGMSSSSISVPGSTSGLSASASKSSSGSVEEGCVSAEGCESWEAEASWPSLSPTESRWVLTKPGMAWGSTGCRTCWISRFLAK